MSEFVTRHELNQAQALFASQIAGLHDVVARAARAGRAGKGKDGADAVVDYERLERSVQEIAARTLATMRLPKDGVSFRGEVGPKGAEGPRGPIGPMPEHEWRGTELRFEHAPGRWGDYVDLQGPAGKDGRTHTSYSVVNEGGAGGTSDGSVPYYVAPTEIFRVPLYRQALFSRTIEVDGYLDVSGDLILVE